MQGSVHKKIIFAGFGCAGVFVILAVIGLLLVPRAELNQPKDQAFYTLLEVSAARDSLEALRPRLGAPRWGAAKPPDGTFWRLALIAMRAERPVTGFRALPYGDTFPPGSRERQEWTDAADWHAVSVLLGRATGHGERGDTARQFDQTDANLILSVARALNARARRALTSPLRLGEATAAERAAIWIGRGLEAEPDLEHVLLGARVTHDALQFLAGAPMLASRLGVQDPARALVRCDSDLAELRAVRRLMAPAGATADNVPLLESWARDSALALAVRRDAVRAISYGWVFNTREPVYGLSPARARALAALAALELPAPIAVAVGEGQEVQRLGVAQRFARSLDYRAARDAGAGF